MGQYLILIIWLFLFWLICRKDIRKGIYVVIFSLPAYLLRIKIFSIPTTVLELEIYILFLVWLFKKMPGGKSAIQLFFNDKLFFGACSLFFLGAIISSFLSSDIRISVGLLKGWFFDPMIFGLVLVSVVDKKNHAERILLSFYCSGVLIAASGLIYRFLGILTYDGRVRGIFLSPNHLAMYLCLPFFACFYFLFNSKNRIIRYFFAFSGIVMGVTLYFTYSYGAWLGAVGSFLFLTIFFLRKKKKILGAFGVVAISIILLFLQMGSQKFENLIESPRSPLSSRIMVWQAAFKIGTDNFIFGIGPGMFQKYYLDYQKYFIPYLEWAVPQPHNIILAFWIQNGIIGAVGFILLAIWFFKRGKVALSFSVRDIAICLMVFMSYFLIHGLVDTPYWKNDLSVIFWCVILLMFLLKKLSLEK